MVHRPSDVPPHAHGYADRSTPARLRSRAWIVWLTWVCVTAAMALAGGSGMFEEQFP